MLPTERFYRVVTKDGATVTGRLLNIDTFTVQMIDTKEQLRSFVKADLREHGFVPIADAVVQEHAQPQELADVVSYLVSLKGRVTSMTRTSWSLRAGCALSSRVGVAARPGDVRSHSARRPRAAELALVLGDAVQSALQPADADHAGEREEPELQWVWQARSLEKFEATALVVDGVLYTVQAPNDVVALDAVTGRPFWTLRYTPAPDARTCCGRVNRGLAILGDTLFMGTIDAHLLALDAKSGEILWNTDVASAKRTLLDHACAAHREGQGHRRHGRRRHGPIRGLIAAFDAKTGKELWRFYTIPGPGEPGNETWSGDSWKTGGAGVWNAGAYDPETNLVVLRHRQPRAGLGRPLAARRQPLQRQRRRARCRHRAS